jgi:acetyltransferase
MDLGSEMPDSASAPTESRHRLSPLLAPRSVALVGASRRDETIGNLALKAMTGARFSHRLYPVNPKYDSINGLKCYSSLAEVPETVDLALLNLASRRLESALEQAISCGARSALIFDPVHVEGESSDIKLVERLRVRATEANIPICGGNCAGIFNFERGDFLTFMQPPTTPPGSISLISHSGMMLVWTRSDPRYRFNIAIHAGQEIGVTIDEYLDYTLTLDSTKVVCLFVEGIRNPDGMDSALWTALGKNVPVVICMVGRTKCSAGLSLTHTGATVANGDLTKAYFESRGAVVVETLDDMYNTALLLAQGRTAPTSGAAYVLDSGGCRGLMVDRAEALGIELASFTDDTTEELRAKIPPMLVPINPFDGAGPVDENYSHVFEVAYKDIHDDANVGMIGIEFHYNDHFNPRVGAVEAFMNAFKESHKPFFYFTSITPLPNEGLASRFADAGVPAINGMDSALRATRFFLESQRLRERAGQCADDRDALDLEADDAARLSSGAVLGEVESLNLLGHLGLPVVENRLAEAEDGVASAADEIGYPVALKAVVEGLHHKTEARGVAVGLVDKASLVQAHREMAGRNLGEKRLVQAMASDGVEFSLGAIIDPSLGAFVSVGGGGRNVELFREWIIVPAPFGMEIAQDIINDKAIARLLDGARGFKPSRPALADCLIRFSRIVAALAGYVQEIDVNPLIVGGDGVLAVDGLIVQTR